jgi:hypothetical protein
MGRPRLRHPFNIADWSDAGAGASWQKINRDPAAMGLSLQQKEELGIPSNHPNYQIWVDSKGNKRVLSFPAAQEDTKMPDKIEINLSPEQEEALRMYQGKNITEKERRSVWDQILPQKVVVPEYED